MSNPIFMESRGVTTAAGQKDTVNRLLCVSIFYRMSKQVFQNLLGHPVEMHSWEGNGSRKCENSLNHQSLCSLINQLGTCHVYTTSRSGPKKTTKKVSMWWAFQILLPTHSTSLPTFCQSQRSGDDQYFLAISSLLNLFGFVRR